MENKFISEAVCYTHGQLSKSISTIPRFKPKEARSFVKETCMSFLESNQSAIMKESRDVFCIFNYFHYTNYFFPKVYHLLFKVWELEKDTTFMFGHFNTISGHVFANYIFIFHKI